MPLLSHARARRQSWWWLAMLVLGLLAPGVSAALAHARGDFSAWQDICRAPGATGQTTESRPIDKALDMLTHGHCAACHIAAAGIAPPPVAPSVTLPRGITFEAPERFWTAPVSGHAWRPASARAPPALI